VNQGDTRNRQLGFPLSPATAENTHSSGKLCFSFSVIECFFASQNETLLLLLKYFVLPKTVCILQKPIRLLVIFLSSFYISITIIIIIIITTTTTTTTTTTAGIFVSSCKQTGTVH
jgi:hypothetical protein